MDLLYTIGWWRWIFPSRWTTTVLATSVRPQLAGILRDCFSLLFPDDCRICQSPLTEISRIPVCRKCLDASPTPFEAEYFCVSCRLPFANAAPLDAQGRCPMCRLGLLGFDGAYCHAAYEGTLRELIHLFKYGRVATLAAPLGRRLFLALPRDQRFDLIVPMPMHWRRRWQRGFNQAELLAREIARRTALPVVNAVKRVRATDPQAGLSNSKRRANVAGAFAVKKARTVSGKRVLLVDDVMTTGATASACAAALKKGGATHVAVLALARVDRRWNSLAVPAITRDGIVFSGAS